MRLLHRVEDVTHAQRDARRLRILESVVASARDAEAAAPRSVRGEAARLEAQRARERIVGILENITDAFFALDAEWRFTYVNRRAEKILGHRPEDLLGRTIWEVFPRGYDAPIGLALREAMATQRKVELEARSVELGRWVHMHAHPSPEGLSVYGHDITERRAVEQAIRENERLLRGIFELLPVGIWIADASGTLVRSNPAGERIWAGARYVGIPEFGAYKGWWADTGEPLAPEDWGMARAIRHGEISIGEVIRIQALDGTFKTVLHSAMPLFDDDGALAGGIVVLQDITRLKEVEEELRRAIRSRDEVLGVVAHDLRNPLGAILAQAAALERRGGDGESLRRASGTIRRLVRRMEHQIRDLLDLARLDAGRLELPGERLRAGELLRQTLELQQPIVSAADRELSLEMPEEPPEILADRDGLERVLENLVDNAVKFTDPGGRIAIGAAPRGDEVTFWVADDGMGIAPEQLPYIFDRHWQAGRMDRRGAGLGLSIVKGIVEAMGGRVWADSRPGQGSTFYFTVRTAPEEPAAHVPPPAP